MQDSSDSIETKPSETSSSPATRERWLHPEALNDSAYESAPLRLNEFATPQAPWRAADGSGEDARFETADGAAIRLQALSENLLRIRMDPRGAVDAPTTTERLGLLRAPAETPPTVERLSEGEVRAGGFAFSLDVATGDFSVDYVGQTVLRTRDGGVRVSEEAPDYGAGFRALADFELEEDESIWGFGGRMRPFARRGSAVDVFSVKGGKLKGDYSGFPIPFFMSSRGCGVFLNNPWPHVYFDLGATLPDRWWVNTPGGEFDLFLVGGPEPQRMLRTFTELVGRIPFPNKALFGFWASSLGFESADQVLEVAERLRAEGWPCDNMVLDGPWRGGPEFIPHYRKYRHYMNNDLEWHPGFGDGPAMVRRLHALGIRVALHLNSRIFTEATAERGLRDGVLRRFNEEVVPKLEDEAGEAFFLNHLKPRIEEGVDHWWTDHSDRVGGTIREGVPSRNLFGPLWNRLLCEAMEAAGREPEPCLSRGGGIGSQPYALPWPGDTAAGLDRFAEDIWFCLGAGLAGFPVTSVDAGGFAAPDGADTDAEAKAVIFGRENLHRRLFPSLLFVPSPRIHNNYTSQPRLPWNCPEESRDLYKAFLLERYALAPFFYSLGIQAHRTGDPILRPLFYHFFKDRATHAVTDVFMIGDVLLVAPVLTPGAKTWRFYCPPGLWYDYWTGERIEGGRDIERPAPIDALAGLPVLARGGSLLPRQAPASPLSPEPPRTLELTLYPDAAGHAKTELHEGPELTHRFRLKADGAEWHLHLENATTAPRTFELKWHDGRSAGTVELPAADGSVPAEEAVALRREF